MTIRLRQVALVARDPQSPLGHALSKTLGVDVAATDSGLAEFGLVNALFTIGDAFSKSCHRNKRARPPVVCSTSTAATTATW